MGRFREYDDAREDKDDLNEINKINFYGDDKKVIINYK